MASLEFFPLDFGLYEKACADSVRLNKDMPRLYAAAVLGKDYEQVSDGERYAAKATLFMLTYGTFYGRGPCQT